jgi:two-component system, LytTR family, response regulator LytT
MIRIAIVEDEILQSDSLSKLLRQYAQGKGLAFEISTFMDGESFLATKDGGFDLVFMDINLPGRNGMEVAREMRTFSQDSFLVFVTDLAQYAIRGYEVDAMDFLVKPVLYSHLCSRLDKMMKLLSERKREDKIRIKSMEGLIFASPNSIRYIEIIDHTLIFHMDGKNYHASGSLNEMEKTLAPYGFSRCNHCYLVNLAYVTAVDKYCLYLGQETLIISRNRKKQFLDEFTDYLGKHN